MFKPQAHWTTDAQASREDVEDRYNGYWEHATYQAQASIENKATFLVRHGPQTDLEAVGRWLRDAQVEEFTEDQLEARGSIRSRNEAFYVDGKRLPSESGWHGQVEMLRRFWVCGALLQAEWVVV